MLVFGNSGVEARELYHYCNTSSRVTCLAKMPTHPTREHWNDELVKHFEKLGRLRCVDGYWYGEVTP